jgi:hypothetical protein
MNILDAYHSLQTLPFPSTFPTQRLAGSKRFNAHEKELKKRNNYRINNPRPNNHFFQDSASYHDHVNTVVYKPEVGIEKNGGGGCVRAIGGGHPR